MSAVLAFTGAPALTEEVEYIDEPCSADHNVRGGGNTNNVTYVNFLPAAQPTTRLRMTKRGRRVLVGLVALPLVIAAFLGAVNSGGAAATGEVVGSSDYTYVTVSQGMSLWDLAQEIAPTADTRDVVAQIVSLNALDGELQPGQKIALPKGY